MNSIYEVYNPLRDLLGHPRLALNIRVYRFNLVVSIMVDYIPQTKTPANHCYALHDLQATGLI